MPRFLLRPLACSCIAAALALACPACGGADTTRPLVNNVVPHHDHVAVVIMENKSYDEVRSLPYTASLIANGGTCTNSFGVIHPSQPNYFAIWSGYTQGVANDNCPAPGSPFSADNLGHACEAAGLSWRAYSENLPSPGATGCSYDGNASTGLYTRKHDPWTYFSNLNHNNERPYSDLAADIAGNTLPNLIFIVPNNCHNTHNSSTAGCQLPDGDTWLANNLPSLMSALGPNGVLILTWDEDDTSASNHILTVFSGPQVVSGSTETRHVDHYTVCKTIADLLGVPSAGLGLSAFETPISEIWMKPTAANGARWGSLKVRYR
jgi:phosphatidylinositol-3-phosphatase